MIKEILGAYAMSSGRKFVDREQTVGASEVGQCARKIYFAKNFGDHVYGAASDALDFVLRVFAVPIGHLYGPLAWRRPDQPGAEAHLDGVANNQ